MEYSPKQIIQMDFYAHYIDVGLKSKVILIYKTEPLNKGKITY